MIKFFMIDFLERRRPAARRHFLFIKFKNLIIEFKESVFSSHFKLLTNRQYPLHITG
jgi:hypothetical protein